VGVHFWAVRETALISPGIRTCLDVDAISSQNVLGHRLQSRRAVNVERNCAARYPAGEDQIGISGSVIGMEVGDERYLQTAELAVIPLLRRGLSAAHYACSEVNEVSSFINGDHRGRAGSVRIRHWRAGPEKHDLCSRRTLL
jgi:hypothetical protein